LNILYVLYENFISNSAIHVHGFAGAMAERGHECIVAVPSKKETAAQYFKGRLPYLPAEYSEIANQNILFSEGKGPDIIHAWTPRENVKNACECFKRLFPESKTIVHLEDNEDVLLSSLTRIPLFILKILPDYLLKVIIPDANLAHPRYYKRFLKDADGITIIMDTLCEMVNADQPYHILWPIIDDTEFALSKDNLKKKLGIGDNEVVVSYIGNAHRANAGEVKSLYEAVEKANQNGIPVRLIRTGTDNTGFLKRIAKRLRKYSIELGYVEREMIPLILNVSDILIQPGKAGKFNDYRLPSKIPEFLSMGKPVALPNTNIGRFLQHNKEVLLMENGGSTEIFSVIKRLTEDKNLCKRISEGAKQYAQKHFNKEHIAKNLESFYRRVCEF